MPPRSDLTKQQILDAALKLVDEGGLEALSMRRIAAELGVSPMGLYRRVETRGEILDGLIEQALTTIEVEADPGAPWDEQLRRLFSDVHATLLRHPGLIAILTTQPISAERAMRAVESTLAALRAAGFSAEDAVAAVAALQSYTFGFTVQQRARSATDQRGHLRSLRALPEDEYPQIHELAADFSSWTAEEHFEIGLNWLIEESAPRTPLRLQKRFSPLCEYPGQAHGSGNEAQRNLRRLESLGQPPGLRAGPDLAQGAPGLRQRPHPWQRQWQRQRRRPRAGDDPIVLVHGLSSSRSLKPLLRALGDGRPVFAPDLPGFGMSDPPVHSLDVPELADELRHWMLENDLAPAHLIGISFGCQVAVDLAATYPASVDRLVLVGPAFDPRADTPGRLAMRWARNAPHTSPRLAPTIVHDVIDAGPLRSMRTLRTALEYRFEERLGEIEAPTLVIRPERDHLVPAAWSEHVADRIEDAELVVLPKTSHTIGTRGAARLTALLAPFLADGEELDEESSAEEQATAED